MNKHSLILGIALLLLSSCIKENLALKSVRETEDKMAGKWMVQQTIDELYDPLPTLSNTIEYIGTSADIYDFRTSTIVEISSATNGNKDEVYTVWNPYQVVIGDISWRIEKLTSSELTLVWDRNDAVQFKRFVTRVYLKR